MDLHPRPQVGVVGMVGLEIKFLDTQIDQNIIDLGAMHGNIWQLRQLHPQKIGARRAWVSGEEKFFKHRLIFWRLEQNSSSKLISKEMKSFFLPSK